MRRLDRVLIGLGLLLVIQLGVFAVIRWSGNRSEESRPLVPGLAEAPISRIVLGGTSTHDKTLTIEKKNDAWVLASLGDYPAEARSIEALLRTLLVLRARGPIVSKEQSHDALEISDGKAQGRLRLFTSDSAEPFTDLTFGSSSPSGAAYVRDSDDAAVYEILGLAAWDVRADAAPWLEQPFVEMPIQNVAAIRLERTDASFTIRRTGDGWVVDDGRRTRDADTTVVAEMLRLLGSLAPVEPAARTDGGLPDTSARLLTVRCEMHDGGATTFTFGTGSADGRVTVASPDRTHAAEVWKSSLEPLLELTAETSAAR